MFKQGDRVVLQSDFKYYKSEVKAGTIGTITVLLDDEKAIVCYGYDHFVNRQLIAGIPIDLLRLATLDELSSISYESLISPMYHIGKKIIMGLDVSANDIKAGDIGIISSYTYALNEKDDLFNVSFLNDNDSKTHSLKLGFIEAYCNPYDEEFENQMGDQIEFDKLKKNFHLVGARMFLSNTDSADNVVILIDKKENELFEVIDLEGNKKVTSKDSLIPIDNPELFATIGNSMFIRKEFSIGKRFKAKDEISKNILLNDEFKPGDVVEVIHINEICINSFDDTVIVERTGGNAVVLSVTEIANYFEPFVGMVKKSTGKVVSKSDDLAEIEKEMLGEKPKEDKVQIMMPLIGNHHEDLVVGTLAVNTDVVDTIKINDITINGFRFTINEDNLITLHNNEVPNLNDYIRSLNILGDYMKGR